MSLNRMEPGRRVKRRRASHLSDGWPAYAGRVLEPLGENLFAPTPKTYRRQSRAKQQNGPWFRGIDRTARRSKPSGESTGIDGAWCRTGKAMHRHSKAAPVVC